MRGLIIVLLAASAWAQSVHLPAPIFPADNEKPKEGGAAELLEAVCPGKVVTGKEITCGDMCPEFTGFSGRELDWSVVSVIHGHFLSATSDDAALSTLGCEGHPENYGGTVLLTRQSRRWKMLWYKAGVQTTQCHKVPLADGREILACMGRYGGWQGWASTSLYLEDLLEPAANLSAEAGNEGFFEIFDDTGTCGLNDQNDAKPNPLTLQYIERVAFGVQRRNKTVLSVIMHYGERAMTPATVKQCEQERTSNAPGSTRFYPPTKRYEIDFLFDGHDYHVAPWSPKVGEVAAGH